ncbi:MAG: DUF2065 domain-containing protein [Burkholderiales bacterium]|jgi:hypothetical protein|nr:DUF2065 domain-containing protein [Burkholderiales bacterium]
MGSTLLMALGLMLILEGALPLAAPALWREAFRRVTEYSDGQIRFFGLASMAGGIALFALAR